MANGAVTVGLPTPIPQAATRAKVAVARNAWPDNGGADVVRVRVDLSLDGGLTYSPDPDGRQVWPWGPYPIIFTARGGVLKDANGVEIPESFTVDPLPPGLSRMLRVTVTQLITVDAPASVITL